VSTRHIAAEDARLHDLTPQGSSGRASKRFRQKLAADGFTVDEGFRLKPGYLYTVVRAISARVNQNYDGWPSHELKKAYKTFIGKPVFVNHENHDPTKARGVVVAARYAENGMDKYIEVVQEIDAGRFPKLAHEIKTGGLDSVSMGAEAGFTICSYCHNKATDLHDMCDHVINHKGKTLSRFDRRTGNKEDILVFESCHKISFFELSYVFEPADETAVASKVVVAGLDKHAGDCPPGMDCSRSLAQGEQISKDSPNNPVNQVSYTPGNVGNPAGAVPGGGGGSPDADNILPSSRSLYDSLMEEHPGAEIGGYRVDSYGEHARGALDFMTTDDAVATRVREKAFAAGAPYVIWKQQQWNADGSVSGMEDRGDPTQNHFDHVHIAPLPATAVATPAAPEAPASTGVQQTQRAAGKYTKEDFANAGGKKPWETDTATTTRAPVEEADLKEIEAMIRAAGATDDYEQWKAEFGEAADGEHEYDVGQYSPSPAQQRWLQEVDRRHRHLTAESLTNPEHAQDTTRRNTIATYLASHDMLNGLGAPKGHSLDFGAGWGDSAGHPDLNARGAKFHTLEPYPNKGMVPDFKDPSHIDDGTYSRIHSLNVVNVAEAEARDGIVHHIGRILAPGGHAVITARGRREIEDMLKVVDKNGQPVHTSGPDSDPGGVVVNGNSKDPNVRKRYQKGFHPDELHQYVQGVLGDGYTVRKVKVGSAPAAVHIVRHPDNIPAQPPRPIAAQVKAARTKHTARSAALRKVAHNTAIRLAWGEQEAPMAVDTLRQEGTAPEDDNNDFERYVDPPKDLQTPDLSQAAQIDRQQEIQEAGQDTGIPGQAEGGPAPQQQEQGNFITLKIPMPSEAPQVPQQAAPPVALPPQQPPMQMAASVLDYFDNYYGRRIANWLDAVEANRAFTPEEAADYRRQAAKLSTLENGREHPTTGRNPQKGTANMARRNIASRNKVATAGRRQHFAEGPLVDGGERGRNNQGEQEEAFISQTPPKVPVDFPDDDTPNITNTEHNLVARVQQGRAQLLRDAQQLASLRQRRAFDEAGGPTAEVVDPRVHTGPEGEALTGDDFISADPNDGVVPTNPKDASLRAFKAFDGWLAQKTGKSSRRHSEVTIKKAAAAFSREAGISPQALFPALGIVLREARKNDKKANTRGAKMRKRADEKLEVAAPDGRIDVEAPVENVTDAEAQASQFDLRDFGDNAGDNVADPDLSTDQNWAPGEASKTSARVKTAGGLLAMRCAEGMITAGLEPNSRERKYQLAAEFEQMNRGLIQDRVALLERFAAVRQADLRKVASGSSRGAARSPIPAGLGGGTRTAAAPQRLAAHDPRNDSSLFI
jgi:hypothetical protein